MNTRGNIALDILVMVVCLFVLGIFFLYVYTPVHTVNQDLIASNATGNQGTQLLINNDAQFPSIFDTAGMLFLIGVWAFLLISAYFIDTHPIFFVIMLFIMIFCYIGIVNVGYAFQNITTSDNLQAAVTAFPKLYFINQHLFELSIFVFFTGAIAMFAKRRSIAGGGGL